MYWPIGFVSWVVPENGEGSGEDMISAVYLKFTLEESKNMKKLSAVCVCLVALFFLGLISQFDFVDASESIMIANEDNAGASTLGSIGHVHPDDEGLGSAFWTIFKADADCYLTQFQSWFMKLGAPNGAMRCSLYDVAAQQFATTPTTVLKVADNDVLDSAVSDSSYSLHTFYFDGEYQLEANHYYAMVVILLNGSNIGAENRIYSHKYSTNALLGAMGTYLSGSWTDGGAVDWCCRLYVSSSPPDTPVVPDPEYCDCLLDGDAGSDYWSYTWSSASGVNLSDYQYPYALAVEQGHEYGYSGGFFTSPSNTFCDDDGFYYLEVGDWFDTVAGAYGDSLVTGSHQSLKVGGMDGIAAFDLSTPSVGTYTTPHFMRIDVNVQADGAGTKVQNSTFLFEVVPEGAIVTYNGTVFGNGTIITDSQGYPFGSPNPGATFPLPTGGSYDTSDTNALINTFAGYMIPLLLWLIPALIMGYVTHWAKWPILIGLAIGGGLCYLFLGSQYVWMVFLTVIGLVGMAYQSSRGGGDTH